MASPDCQTGTAIVSALENGSHTMRLGNGSRMSGDIQVRFCESAEVRLLRATLRCVFITRGSKRYAEKLREEIAQFLRKECSSELSVEKTHITHVRDGFTFLGFQLKCSIGKSGKIVPKIKVGQKGIQNFKQRIYDAAKNVTQHVSIAARIHRTSQVVRGWGEYFRIAHNYSAVAGRLDYFVHAVMRSMICRKMDIQTAKCYREYYTNGTFLYRKEEVLARLSHKTMKLNYPKPTP